MIRLLKLFGRLSLWTLLLAITAWGAAALWFDGPASRPLAALLVLAYVLTTLALLIRLRPGAAPTLPHWFAVRRAAGLVVQPEAEQ